MDDDQRAAAMKIVASLASEHYGASMASLVIPDANALEELRRAFLAPMISTMMSIDRKRYDPIPETWEARRARWKDIMRKITQEPPETIRYGFRGAPDNSWWHDTPKRPRRT